MLTFVVWRRSELFFLERFSTDTEIALYSIPFGMVMALGMIPLALSGVLSGPRSPRSTEAERWTASAPVSGARCV